jgi:hypothetical protein
MVLCDTHYLLVYAISCIIYLSNDSPIIASQNNIQVLMTWADQLHDYIFISIFIYIFLLRLGKWMSSAFSHMRFGDTLVWRV